MFNILEKETVCTWSKYSIPSSGFPSNKFSHLGEHHVLHQCKHWSNLICEPSSTKHTYNDTTRAISHAINDKRNMEITLVVITNYKMYEDNIKLNYECKMFSNT